MNQNRSTVFFKYTVFYKGEETLNETVLHNLGIGITHIFIEDVMYVYKGCEAKASLF